MPDCVITSAMVFSRSSTRTPESSIWLLIWLAIAWNLSCTFCSTFWICVRSQTLENERGMEIWCTMLAQPERKVFNSRAYSVRKWFSVRCCRCSSASSFAPHRCCPAGRIYARTCWSTLETHQDRIVNVTTYGFACAQRCEPNRSYSKLNEVFGVYGRNKKK